MELQRFQSGDLTARIAQIEQSLRTADDDGVRAQLQAIGAGESTLAAAVQLKRTAGQVNVLVHALGILLVLPDLLEPGEAIEYVSLGAGNTGRQFDLETDRRVGEFKFIDWKGGPEAIRQNSLFKDLYLLEVANTPKRKQLFVLGDTYPLRFLRSQRSLASVMSRNRKLWNAFEVRFGSRFRTVGEYYEALGHQVEIVDLRQRFPGRFAGFEPTLDNVIG